MWRIWKYAASWPLYNGVARFFGVRASNHNGRPWQKLWTLKKSKLFIEFHYNRMSNLQFVKCWKLIFSFKIVILPPMRLCCTGRPHHSPPNPWYALAGTRYWYLKQYKSSPNILNVTHILCSCLTHTSFISKHYTKVILMLLYVSATCCSHHQGVNITNT
jgi:hypothetical protein